MGFVFLRHSDKCTDTIKFRRIVASAQSGKSEFEDS